MPREHPCLSICIEPPRTYIRCSISVLPQTWWSPAVVGWKLLLYQQMFCSRESTNYYLTVLPSLVFAGDISVSAYTFLGSGLMLCLEITSWKNGMLVHLKKKLVFVKFQVCLLVYPKNLVKHWCLPCSLNLQLEYHQQYLNNWAYH